MDLGVKTFDADQGPPRIEYIEITCRAGLIAHLCNRKGLIRRASGCVQRCGLRGQRAQAGQSILDLRERVQHGLSIVCDTGVQRCFARRQVRCIAPAIENGQAQQGPGDRSERPRSAAPLE